MRGSADAIPNIELPRMDVGQSTREPLAEVLQMSAPNCVEIIGTPVACEAGVKDTWCDVAAWAARQLRAHFGEAVQVRYYELFDKDCPPLPSEAKLPLVMVNRHVLSSGGKISVSVIRKHLEAST
ncbi:MAG: hypothetical protein MUO76_16040 [Anaerolineaceae bacterium]|nr:hypothetical protein [Anaerolineaceae bacterium]